MNEGGVYAYGADALKIRCLAVPFQEEISLPFIHHSGKAFSSSDFQRDYIKMRRCVPTSKRPIILSRKEMVIGKRRGKRG